jgi:hypothetical protein
VSDTERNLKLSSLCFIFGMSIGLCAENIFAGSIWGAGVTPIYGPAFELGSVKAVKLSECKISHGMLYWSGEHVDASCGGYSISFVSILGRAKVLNNSVSKVASHLVVVLKAKGVATAKKILNMSDFPGGGFVDFAYYAELNGDGKPDFIFESGSHANGLGGEFGGRIFLLSSDRGYRYIAMEGVMNDSRLVHLANESFATLILQRMVEPALPDDSIGVLGRDGKKHTYFIFDLIQFDPASLKGAKMNNSQDVRFPFWAQYTNNPQKKETTQLTPASKKALWRDPLQSVVAGALKE